MNARDPSNPLQADQLSALGDYAARTWDEEIVPALTAHLGAEPPAHDRRLFQRQGEGDPGEEIPSRVGGQGGLHLIGIGHDHRDPRQATARVGGGGSKHGARHCEWRFSSRAPRSVAGQAVLPGCHQLIVLVVIVVTPAGEEAHESKHSQA